MSESWATSLVEQAERAAAAIRADAERALSDARTERDAARAARAALERREAALDSRQATLDAEVAAVRERAAAADGRERDLAERERRVAAAEDARVAELGRVAGLTPDDARAELVAAVEADSRQAAAERARAIEDEATRRAQERAREIVTQAIQRCSAEQTTDHTAVAVSLPSPEMKGRVIGRDGRNIRAFESVTGADVIVDDSPDTVLVSSFDPERREAARLTLSALLKDGRIHPGRIESAHRRSVAQLDDENRRAGEEALATVGITDLAPPLVEVLGRLRLRTSYGQNVLKHLIECAQLASVIAGELGLDVDACKRAAFLHDIGKALDADAGPSHALAGAELLRRHGEHADIVHAVEAHHNEVEPRTVEAIVTQACDHLSAGRPGARREAVETYVKRLERLEQLAMAHVGVQQAYAMQAGRDIRVMVAPDELDDAAAAALAEDLARQIEAELTLPGQIQITVIRESRATATAG